MATTFGLQTYKQRLIALLIGSVIFLFIAYQFSIKKTLEERSKYVTAQQQLKGASNIDQELAQLNTLLKDFDTNSSQGPYNEEQLFEQVGLFCENHYLRIISMPSAEKKQSNNYQVSTNIIKVEGSYKPILQLIHQLENQWKYGQVISSDFQKQRNRETRQTELIATIYLQNIQPIQQR